jgi:hypothetical protein|tara:strand:+ start:227 stop:1081 length:855 start_codon:yes stop_codon:yes gene_type:complete
MNELTTVSKSEQLEIAAAMGMGGGSSNASADRLPELKINYQEENAQGQDLPRGQFFVKGTSDDPVFAKSVNFRPLSQLFQWIHYDPEENKVKNKTLMIPQLRQEARDQNGTTRCGKPTSNVLRELGKEEQKRYSDIKCFRQVRGIVSYEGKNADGDTVKVENQPVILMLKGSNFNPFEDEFLKKLPRGRKMHEYSLKVGATKTKGSGGNIWWIMSFEPDLVNAMAMDDQVFETVKVMHDMVKSENEKIQASHEKALHNSQLSGDAIDALASVSGDLEDDLADEA